MLDSFTAQELAGASVCILFVATVFRWLYRVGRNLIEFKNEVRINTAVTQKLTRKLDQLVDQVQDIKDKWQTDHSQ